jgi:hypothetical protein
MILPSLELNLLHHNAMCSLKVVASSMAPELVVRDGPVEVSTARRPPAPAPTPHCVFPYAGRHRHAPTSKGRGVVVEWRSKGSKGKHTARSRLTRRCCTTSAWAAPHCEGGAPGGHGYYRPSDSLQNKYVDEEAPLFRPPRRGSHIIVVPRRSSA